MPQVFGSKGSLQRRLGLALTLAIAALWILATMAAGLVLRHEVDEVFDSALQEVAQRVLPLAYLELLNRDEASADDGVPADVPSVAPHREYITYLVRDEQGRVLLQSHDADPAAFPAKPDAGFITIAGTRFFTENAVKGTLSVTAAERAGHRSSSLVKAMKMLVWPLIVLLPLSLGAIWWLISRMVRPVSRFQAAIETRSHNNLTPLETANLPAEIAPVASAVNALIARLQRAMESERSFASNSAHELRTPVAAALAQTQRLVAELPKGALRLRASSIEAALRRLARLCEKLLQWSRAEGGGLIASAAHDIVPILAHVLDEIRSDPDAMGRLVVELPDTGHALTTLDVDAFAVLVRNLVENALKHGPEKQVVWVRLGDDGSLRVGNPGPIIAQEKLAGLMAPFTRGATDAEGAGLGLAIVASIMKGVGGRLALASPAPGQDDGFEARVQLPGAGN